MHKYTACLAAALFSFYDVFVMSLFNRMNPTLQAQFHLTPHGLGTLSSCFLWANALTLIPVGLLLDRGYVRQTACLLLSTSVLSNGIFIFSHTAGLAMVARFIQGVASAGSLLTCMRLGINWYKEKANAAIGWMIALALSGGIFANFTQSWIVPTGLGAIILVILFLYLHDEPHVKAISPSVRFISKPQNFLLGGYLGLINFPVFVLGALWGDRYLSQHYHLNLTQSSIVSSLIFMGIIVGSPLWGFLANRYIHYKKILYLGCIGLILVCFLLKFIPPNLISISIIFFSLGFLSCTQNIAYFALSEINTPKTLSSATAIAAVIFNCIGAISQILFYSLPSLLLFPLAGVGLLFITFNYSK